MPSDSREQRPQYVLLKCRPYVDADLVNQQDLVAARLPAVAFLASA